jgi:hypothetical protein
MAARVEWERDWLHTFNKKEEKQKTTKQDRINTNLGKAGANNVGLMDLVKGL